MKRSKYRGGAIKRTIILLLFLAAAIWLFARALGRHDEQNYSEKLVSLLEIQEEVTFGSYEKTDWAAFFSSYQEEYLTGELLSQLLSELGVSDYIKMDGISRGEVVNRAEWNEIYTQILDFLDLEGTVRKEKFLILDVVASEDGNILITNQGDYTTHLPASYFLQWRGFEAYCTKNRCIGICCISKEELCMSNAYLTEYKEGEICFLYHGAMYQKKLGASGTSVEEGVCDIVIKEGDICALRMKRDIIEGDLLSYDDTMIEIEGYGKVEHLGKIPVYQICGEVMEKSLSDVVLGNMKLTYVTGDGKVCAILMSQDADIQNIRVLLLADNGTNYREQVYLKSDVDVVLSCGEQQEQIGAGTLIAAENYLANFSTGTLSVMPHTAEGKVFICDAQGNVISNGYQGTMEVRSYEAGYTLVNDVPFETYLCAVVPSEMPSSYEPEALKAQAVCARSYAYIQLLRADLAAYGAHINDSTSYQVYNKSEVTDAARTAVLETAGKMLLYQGQPVEAYYFSTSMGYTDTAVVWNVEDETSYGYLKSVCLNAEGNMTDLSEEDTFRSYISQRAEGYDSDVKYYRWFASANYQEKTREINQILISRRAVAPKNITFLKEDQTTEIPEVTEENLENIGKVIGIKVYERSSAGAILTLCIQYERGSVLVKNEYNIRKVLGIGVEKMVYADSSESMTVSMLPSAFCVLTENEDGTMLLQGGGYGHGIGMSQNGANGMAKAGRNYEEILQYFYKDIKIGSIK